MAEYIERETGVRAVMAAKWVDGSDGAMAMEIVASPPAADVAPVVHGKWERVANPNWPAHIHDKCSICGWWNTRNALCYDGSNKPGHSLNYCPNCGAKMDGDDK